MHGEMCIQPTYATAVIALTVTQGEAGTRQAASGSYFGDLSLMKNSSDQDPNYAEAVLKSAHSYRVP